MSDPLEKIIRPIVEGQIRSFINDHPQVIDAVDWYKPRKNKRLTFVNSVAKRIVRDLLCSDTRMRLVEALVQPRGASASEGRGDMEFIAPPLMSVAPATADGRATAIAPTVAGVAHVPAPAASTYEEE